MAVQGEALDKLRDSMQQLESKITEAKVGGRGTDGEMSSKTTWSSFLERFSTFVRQLAIPPTCENSVPGGLLSPFRFLSSLTLGRSRF